MLQGEPEDDTVVVRKPAAHVAVMHRAIFPDFNEFIFLLKRLIIEEQ